jgi:hypothetical protein
VPSRHLQRRKKRVLLALGLFLPLLLGAILLTFYMRSRAQHLSPDERRQIASHFRGVIERTGGSQVWVKEAPYASFPPPRADAAPEVLVVSAGFDTVLAAMQEEAKGEGLQWQAKSVRGQRGRLIDIRLTRGHELAGRWRLREVARLRRAAIIIDDLGQDLDAAGKLLALPYPLTYSVLPRLRHSVATAEEAHHRGCEVILHLPMEPDSSARAGEGEIRVQMGAGEVRRIIDGDLASVPYAAGVNNHMGSRATTHRAIMAVVMKVLADRHLYFVDSRTTPASVALAVARRQGLPTLYRSVFLDDTETAPYTLGQLREFHRIIDEQGVALAIGHPYPTTLAALAKFLPELARDDIQLVPASQLLHLPEVAHLTPPGPTTP